ncbi:hypothetical protein DTO212C5_5459 [Paecilomyces variotii]|nr:hypothetical protein DTO212C5_5459 [Paecilomyces variotii]
MSQKSQVVYNHAAFVDELETLQGSSLTAKCCFKHGVVKVTVYPVCLFVTPLARPIYRFDRRYTLRPFP